MKKIILTTIVLFISITFLGCNNVKNPNPDYCVVSNNNSKVYLCEKVTTSYFDTIASLKLYYTEDDNYDVISVFNEFERIISLYHKYFDKYNEYENINNIFTINHSDSEIIIDKELFDAIKYAIDNSNIATIDDVRLFDIALGPVLDVWHDARESTSCDDTREAGILYCPVPNDQLLDKTFNTDLDDIVLNEETSTISFLKSDMAIDLGGFAKGYVSTIIEEYLNSLNLTYILNLGNSNVIGHGDNPLNDEGNYIIALIEPSTDFRIVNTYYQYIKLPKDMALVTSGNYQRFFKDIETETVYHHIIDPRTNYPGGDTMSVSVIYPNSAIADILSTAIYLMTLEEGLDFVNNTPDLEAIWYSYDGTITYSDNFLDYQYILEN